MLKDSAIISLNEFYRIRESTNFPTTSPKPQLSISISPLDSFKQNALNHKERLLSFDKVNYKKNPLLTYENQKITDPYTIVKKSDDVVKELNILVKCAKIATIREKQLEEQKRMEKIYKNKEEKLDLMMELERLKEIKFKEEREKESKKLNEDRKKIIINQIFNNEKERLKKKELILKDKAHIKMQIAKFEEEEKKRILYENEVKENRIKECLKAEQYALFQKQKKKIEEKEEELRDAKYNIEKAKREEEYLQEKKRIAAQKEKELQALREKQERAQDKQAALDEIRAKRVQEEAERKAIQKEREAALIKQKKLKECFDENGKFLKFKQLEKEKEIQKEKEEFEKIEKKMHEEIEQEKEKERKKIKMMIENGIQVKNQIDEKEKKMKSLLSEKYEEGQKMKKLNDDYFTAVEMIRKEKIDELKRLNIKDKYILPVEKYKPVKKFSSG